MDRKDVSAKRKPNYEAPRVMRVTVDPVREMLEDCSGFGKNQGTCDIASS